MAKSFKVGNAILCEYAAQGNRNKHTLVNAYSGDVLVSTFPARLNFGFYLEIFSPERRDELGLTIIVDLNNTELFRADVKKENADPSNAIVIVFPMVEIIADKPSTLEVYASNNEFRKTKLISKNILQGKIT